jgi:predicted nucleotidyltransferase
MDAQTQITDPLIRTTLEQLAGELPRGARLIVFGSRATGTASADSDLDLLIVEPEVRDRQAEMARLAALLGRRLVPADVVVLSNESFVRQRDIPNTLAWQAARHGVEYAVVG